MVLDLLLVYNDLYDFCRKVISTVTEQHNSRVTIKDVAREAGVSISTVSNALNGVNVLNPDTRERVLEAAARLNYTPNLNGKNLKKRSTNIIGVFLREIKGPYYGDLIDSIYESCNEYSYELNIFLCNDRRRIVSNILGHGIDGAIILNEAVSEEQEDILMRQNIPAVYMDRLRSGINNSSVVFDSYKGGEEVAKYLLELGNRSFMVIRGPKYNYDSIQREKGFTDVLAEAGITIGKDYFIDGAFAMRAAHDSMMEFIRSGHELPDAIFALNDLSALGAVNAFKECDIKVPEDVSIVGCDDIETACLVTPSLTTIRTNFEKQGNVAVEQLIRMIKGEPGRKIVMSGRIIPRQSTIARKL